MAAKTYIIYNSSRASTAAPVKQPTGTAIRTMLQLKVGTGAVIRPIEWGCSFDGSAAAVPGQIELLESDVGATMSTAFVNADIQRYGDPNGAQQGDVANFAIDVTSASTSGFATAAVTEGTIAASRHADLQLIAPTTQYVKQWPLGREWEIVAGKFLRVRVTFPVTVNMYCYLIYEV